MNFGNLTQGRDYPAPAAGETRCIWAGGYSTSSVYVNTIDYHTTASTGNGSDFGDLTQAKGEGSAGMSNSHGGLQ